MDLSSDMPVTLTIKAPNQRMEDQTVDCMLGWTIKKLKQHLENVYPSKPKHNEQRLIYSGRLLQDHLTLKEILRQYEGSELPNNKHTVHLVCSSSSESFSASDSKATAESSLPQASASNANNFIKEATTSTLGEGLRHRGAPSHGDNLNFRSQTPHFAHQTTAHQQPDANLTPEFPYSPEQYAWMIQNYAYSQYMMQYMQYYQAAYYSGLPYNSQMFPTSFVQQPATNVDVQTQQAQPQAAAAGPAQRANVRMNAQGGVDEEDEDEGEPRDWLHHVYFFMRFLTFMGILFFYSNLTRFLVVFTGSLAVFLLQKMRNYWQKFQRDQQQSQQRQQQELQRQQQEQQQQQQQQQEGSNQQQHSDPANQNGDSSEAEIEPRGEGQEGATEPPQQEQPANGGSQLSRAVIFVFSTIQSFFMSLLPTPPELLEAN